MLEDSSSYLQNFYTRGEVARGRSFHDEAKALQFALNSAIEKARVLMLVAPTCGTCLRGASELNQQVLNTVGVPQVSSYIIWTPQSHPSSALDAPETIPKAVEQPVYHFWDSDRHLLRVFLSVLGLTQHHQDIYMLYEPGALWLGPLPPAPTYWMRRLDADTGPQPAGTRFDAGDFATHLAHSLNSCGASKD